MDYKTTQNYFNSLHLKCIFLQDFYKPSHKFWNLHLKHWSAALSTNNDDNRNKNSFLLLQVKWAKNMNLVQKLFVFFFATA